MNKLKAICVAGARPNFMKIAPLVRAMKESGLLEPVIVHTGQHYDKQLSDVFFDELNIPRPDVNLEVGAGTREEQLATIKQRFAPVVDEVKPAVIVVVGDVTSTIACAEIGREKGVAVAHVEAGLRSFDLTMPEEVNRLATDAISDFLFVTEQSGIDNLAKEKIPGKVYLVGNVMIDTLIGNLQKAKQSDILQRLGLGNSAYLAATFHRPSNVDSKESLSEILEALLTIAAKMRVVLPLHPRTKHSAEKHGLLSVLEATPNITLCEPLGYLDFLQLVSNSKAVVTDSGGIQEEATYLNVPCITMRENTERPVTVDLGSNTLIGRDLPLLIQCFEQVVAGTYKQAEIPPFWDGKASERIVKILHDELRR